MKRTIAVSLFVLLFWAASGLAAIDGVSAPAGAADYAPNDIIVKFRKTITGTLESQLELKKPAGELRLSRGLDELNARYGVREIKAVFKDFKIHRQRMEALEQKDTRLLTKREKHILRRLERAPQGASVPDLSRIYKLEVDLEPGQSLEEVVAAYNADPDVEYAELNYIVSIDLTPNDPLYSIQWPLHNIGQMYPESGKYTHPPGTPDCDIDGPEAWDISTGSDEVIVAVVDTGVDYTHRDLQANMWTDGQGHYGYDFINNDTDPMDDYGHGTHCAGTIAGEADNGVDVAGVCWNAQIMALKFLGSDGHGRTDDAVAAFYYAVQNGAHVVSNSWGGGDYANVMAEAIDYAYSQGVIMVASAGNDDTNEPHYPAYYEHMISVAATDSDDERALFSNYGDWVDIAAPGVDVLSLRASGTSHGTVYDDYTTIMSGTSMACPHVSGGCGLLLSLDAFLTCDEVHQTLTECVDPIAAGICRSGRLNVARSLASIRRLHLDKDYYSCSDQILIYLVDSNLAGQGSQEGTVTTSAGDSESVILHEQTAPVGVFTGTILAAGGEPNIEDGTVQVSHAEIMTAVYQDQNDTATVDCLAAVIVNIDFDEYPLGPGPLVTFETNEPTRGRVLCGLDCAEPNTIVRSDSALATSHRIRLTGVLPETDYFFVVEATDRAGNVTVDHNGGYCYAFTTNGPNDILSVPTEVSTIQEAIDVSWEGGTVCVADGTYTGEGNRDIDFRGKMITVRSESGPESCVIDCNGDANEPHRGFWFHKGEGPNSVLDGFTITNGYGHLYPSSDDWISKGGGIYCCDNSSPTIANCKIENNRADWGGGMENWEDCSPTVINCTFIGNSADDGGGMCNDMGSSPRLVNCVFSGNSAGANGGGVWNDYGCDLTVVDCIFSGNGAGNGGGMLNYGSPTISNCTFIGNSARSTGGGMLNLGSSEVTITKCRFIGNSAGGSGGGMENRCSTTISNCMFSGNSAGLYGGGMYSKHGRVTISNCTFSGNVAIGEGRNDGYGGGMYNDTSIPVLTMMNCVLWGNSDSSGLEESSQFYVEDEILVTVNYNCVQGWTGDLGGIGNMGDDPLLAEDDGPDNTAGTEDDNLSLLAGSACLDAGDNSAVSRDTTDLDGDGDLNEPIPFDVDGNPRFTDDPNTPDTGNGTPPIVDMGAYEGRKQGFLLNRDSGTVAEGQTATFTVSLAMDPNRTVEVTVAVESGDADITVQSGGTLIFESSNYGNPQTVTLAAAEDLDYFHGESLIWISAAGFVTAGFGPNSPGVKDGTSWEDAFSDLQDALGVAAVVPQVDEIRVGQGSYRPAPPDGDREATFQLINGLRLKGGYAGFGEPDPNARDINVYHTILSGDLNGDDVAVSNPSNLKDEPTRAENSHHVVTGSGTDGTAVLSGFTITAGRTGGSGAGMYNNYGSPTVSSCRFVWNCAESGGGMSNDDSSPRLTNCTISQNAGLGENWGSGSGGGIHNAYYSNPRLTNCTISGNASGAGAGIYNFFYSSPTITNCTISGNTSEPVYSGGGGIYCSQDSNPILTNCTIRGNVTTEHGGGIYCRDHSDPIIINCILWDNSPEQIYVRSGEIPFVTYYSDVEGGWEGMGNIDADPVFVDANGPDNIAGTEDDNLRLSAGSPCIDAGNCNYFMTLPCTDHEGGVRLVADQIDMGCYEFGSSPDSDGDWLSDNSEMGYEDDPDRDNDGLLDGLEILRGTDPCVFDPLGRWNIPADADSIQEALFLSRDGEIVALSEGTHYENIYMGGLNITLTSNDPCDPNVVGATIINGDTDTNPLTRNGPVIIFAGTEDSNCQLVGLTITGGYSRRGAGIYGAGTGAGLSYCTISGNRADDYGGGIYGCDGPISYCTIKGNWAGAEGGGGISRCDGSIVGCMIIDNVAEYFSGGGLCRCDGSIVDCTISGNRADDDGGGLGHCDGLIAECTISGNSAGKDGGGLDHCDGRITGCAISGNSAGDDGGGMYYCKHARLRNCVITDNAASDDGGGMYKCNYDAISNCTISGNSANDMGGGIRYRSGSYLITNCIIWDNNAPYGPQIYLEDTNDLSITFSDIESGWQGPGNINAHPSFADPCNGDYHLESEGGRWDANSKSWVLDSVTSPCIDKGDFSSPVGDEPYPNGGRINMGAYGGTAEASKAPAITCREAVECAGHKSGDATCDGNLDLADLFALKVGFGRGAPWADTECCADFNHDDSVNLGDLFILKANFGSGPYSPSTGNQDCPP
ncbi:MAG: S8 family serine peptidase [Planctomycetota bacterium]|jgi:subtilisin family serine protease